MGDPQVEAIRLAMSVPLAAPKRKKNVAALLLSVFALVFFLLLLAGPIVAEQDDSIEQDRSESRTPPLMRGTLWWLGSSTNWSKEELEQAIQAQCDIGFNLLWISNTPSLLKQAEKAGVSETDLLEAIYSIADSHGMQVIADLPHVGFYGKNTAEEILATSTKHIQGYQTRYGHHESFWGWYLNYEINPIAPSDVKESKFWRSLWRAIADECHCSAPGSVVTISPFFLLDGTSRRGFVYLTPEQNAAWWGKTMQETGIDILMLQDSGEHLSFFTLEQREPFFACLADACHKAGAQFWVNVESGEIHVADWDDYLAHVDGWGKHLTPKSCGDNGAPWRFTPIDWLEQKLQLAARYGDNIVNWGYFPFMDPLAVQPNIDKACTTPLEAYQDYKSYYTRVSDELANQKVK